MTEVALNDARRLTERIRLMALTVGENIDKLKTLVTEAKESEAHTALGYASWQAYLADVLGETPMRLARDIRGPLSVELEAQGLSNRAIGAIVGVDEITVRRDLAGATNVAPARIPDQFDIDAAEAEAATALAADPITGEVIEPAPPRKIQGLDGKTYKIPPPRSKPDENPSAELTLINDIRLYLRKLSTSTQVARLTDAGKQHIVTALQDAIAQIERN
jgi:hypothetical protein